MTLTLWFDPRAVVFEGDHVLGPLVEGISFLDEFVKGPESRGLMLTAVTGIKEVQWWI
jgi:hypothetical protein